MCDPKKAVNDYYQETMKELMESINSPLWRIREATCMALADILQGIVSFPAKIFQKYYILYIYFYFYFYAFL